MTVDQLAAAQQVANIVSVQNMYNLTVRTSEALLDKATEEGIAFIPWFPLASGPLAASDGPLQRFAADHHATPSQLALAWVLAQGDDLVPIPGTKHVRYLEENAGATEVRLSADDLARIEAVFPAGAASGTRYPEAGLRTVNR